MNFLENITFRRTRTQSQTDNTEEGKLSESTIDGTVENVSTDDTPNNISTDEESSEKLNTLELQKQIETLKNELKLAYVELNRLSAENQLLKKVQQNVDTLSTNTCNSRKKAKKRKNTNTSTNNITESPNKKAKSSSTPQKDIQKNETSRANKNVKNINLSSTNIDSEKQTRRKMCIISSNNSNKVLQISQNTFQDSQIIHYITPNAGIAKLTENIDKKIGQYSLQDCCILMIGEHDFSTTNNYFDIIINLRETLQTLDHTNVIICLPTYKCKEYCDVFNWRVETFNNLLYLDVLSHNYAYLFDSNLQLSYNSDMFSKFKGIINNKGMQNMFKNLKQLYTDIIECNNDYINNNKIATEILNDSSSSTKSETDFFLP